MKILDVRAASFECAFQEVLARGKMDIKNVSNIVQEILDSVQENGLAAIKAHIAQFDKWEAREFSDICITQEQCLKAYNALPLGLKSALHVAYDRIYAFHQKQKEKSWIDCEANGSLLGSKLTPMERAGLYIPGGKAAYPSSLLMNAIPAIVAGVKEIVVCSPTPNNEPHSLLLAALHLCGIKEIYKVGGASAIGLMAYGCKEVPKVDVITGPGNIFVACAKKLVFGEVNIDMIAGPSEIAIIADKDANARYVAYDLLSQAEHDEMASSILISDNLPLIESVQAHIQDILPTLSRAHIAEKSIQNRAVMIHTRSLKESIDIANALAPEHLEILCNEAFAVLPLIKHAGAIFLGQYSSEPIGDYLAGPNHTLPTGGSARFFSPLSVEHFMKRSSIIAFSAPALAEMGEACALLAQSESLQAHAQAVLTRLDSISTRDFSKERE
ncbi:histidinol dehydrogenase [Helicobacter jaachi]|uniref:Histidinol dehydrogenase n=1 Tax=Helicobacter jaachi TaxID=1677920 RepID=A0A4U8T9S8_9HELI|nr:histidinol dehydrogenase [Helicobacter jaachi]TLD96590.1 histidinol dehydrogenase [Helicobacter jaachi]